MTEDFRAFSRAGAALADWHLSYDTVDPWPLDGLPGPDTDPRDFRVEKLRFAGGVRTPDRSTIVVNGHVTLSGIPKDAYRH